MRCRIWTGLADQRPPASLTQAHVTKGPEIERVLALHRGDVEMAWAHADERLTLTRELGDRRERDDPDGIADRLNGLWAWPAEGETLSLENAIEEALRAGREE